ncbi:MAG: hypothetical protein WBV39_08150 [Rudaea sp.]
MLYLLDIGEDQLDAVRLVEGASPWGGRITAGFAHPAPTGKSEVMAGPEKTSGRSRQNNVDPRFAGIIDRVYRPYPAATTFIVAVRLPE